MDLRRRYDAWVEVQIETFLEDRPGLTLRRDDLAAILERAVPWERVRTAHLYVVAASAADVAPRVEAPGVPLIVDGIVEWLGTPLGGEALDRVLPPDGAGVPDPYALLFPARPTQEEFTEGSVFARSFPGRILVNVFTIAPLAWEELSTEAESALGAVRAGDEGGGR